MITLFISMSLLFLPFNYSLQQQDYNNGDNNDNDNIVDVSSDVEHVSIVDVSSSDSPPLLRADGVVDAAEDVVEEVVDLATIYPAILGIDTKLSTLNLKVDGISDKLTYTNNYLYNIKNNTDKLSSIDNHLSNIDTATSNIYTYLNEKLSEDLLTFNVIFTNIETYISSILLIIFVSWVSNALARFAYSQ